MTAKQRAARAKFKAVVAEAKKLRKKNPKLTQAQAVKQAWAISYSKKRGGTISKINVMNKSALQDLYKKNEQNNEHSENVLLLAQNFGNKSDVEKAKEILKVRNKQGYLTVQQNREANKIHDKLYKKLFPGKVGAVKKKAATKVKAKKRAATEMHTDTKSHNVNIRVISGMDQYKQLQFVLNDIKFLSGRIAEQQKIVDSYKKLPASLKKDPIFRISYEKAKQRIPNLKAALIKAKKNIKL